MTYEGIRLKVNEIRRKLVANRRKKRLKIKDFTIISNNCWGGMIYESYNLQKKSPTVGLFFMASDYVKFISNMRYYMAKEIEFINPYTSKWVEDVCTDKRFGTYPVGKIDDIEIFFLHYHSEQEAREKWIRRCKRINWDKMIVKFNDQNKCSEQELVEFLKLEYPNKIFFTCKKWNIQNSNIIFVKQKFEKEHILASYEPFGENRIFNVTSYINDLK